MYENRGIKKYVVIGVLVVIALIVLIMVINALRVGTLLVTAPSTAPGGKSVQIDITRADGDKPMSFKLEQGKSKKVTLRAGVVRVNGSVGNIKSVDIVTIAARKTTRLTSPQGEQRAIHKLGSVAKNCPVVVAGVTYSYNCGGDGPVYRHEKIDPNRLDPHTVLFGGATFGYLQPFKDGLLGFPDGTSGDGDRIVLSYANLAAGTMTAVTLPSNIDDLMQSGQPEIITDPIPGQPYFLLIFRQKGVVYLFNDIGGAPPVRLTLPQNAKLNDSARVTTFQFSGDHIVMYAGNGEAQGEGEVGEDGAKPEKGLANNITEYDLSGKSIQTIALAKDFSANEIDKVNSSFYVAQRLTGVDFYHLTDGKLRQIYQMQDAATPLVIGDNVYIEADGTIYKVGLRTDGTFKLESVFTSAGLTVSALYRADNNVLFTGLSAREDQHPLDIYQLLDSQQLIPPLEDTLKLTDVSDIITGYDYDDQTVLLALTSVNASNAPYSTIIGNLNQILQARSISLGGRQVQLYPLN